MVSTQNFKIFVCFIVLTLGMLQSRNTAAMAFDFDTGNGAFEVVIMTIAPTIPESVSPPGIRRDHQR